MKYTVVSYETALRVDGEFYNGRVSFRCIFCGTRMNLLDAVIISMSSPPKICSPFCSENCLNLYILKFGM